MHNSSESNKKLVTQFFDALNRGDVAFIVDAYAADGCVQTMGNTLISGIFSREQIAASAAGIFDVFPSGLTFTILSMVGEGNKVAVEATSEGEHVSGQTYSNEYHFLFEFQSGKLIRLKEYMDTERVTDILCGGQRPLDAI
ncbi:MAG: nuclear transport factor 2 family protein [Halioglobus sp.]|nr:nuclear transport factor 2 family protein [Halioglobus sp.]